jgi:lipopolysaccharide transport protein LptA
MKSGNVVRAESDYGRSYLSRKVVDLNGDVRITSKQGYRFRMENLTYQGMSRQFSSPDLVKMEGPDPEKPRMRLRGTGLIGHVDNEHFFLKKQVHGERRLGGSGDWLKIDSQQGDFFTGEQRSIFSGKVKAVMPKMTVDCDKLKLLLSGESEDIEATGNVKVLMRNRAAYADTASLVVGGNQILLEGKARVDSKDNQIRGRKILLFTDEDRIEVEEAEGSSSS